MFGSTSPIEITPQPLATSHRSWPSTLFAERISRAQFVTAWCTVTSGTAVLYSIEHAIHLMPSIGLLSLLPAMVLYTSLYVRRLHDLNYSGWWTFWLWVPPGHLILFVIAALRPSVLSANRFGSPPQSAPLAHTILGY